MTIQNFADEYYLHDSYFEDVLYDESSATVVMKINFCFWMQDKFKEGDDENGIMVAEFKEVSSFSYDGGEIDYESIGILKAYVKQDRIVFALLDDFNDEYHELSFAANRVNVTFK